MYSGSPVPHPTFMTEETDLSADSFRTNVKLFSCAIVSLIAGTCKHGVGLCSVYLYVYVFVLASPQKYFSVSLKDFWVHVSFKVLLPKGDLCRIYLVKNRPIEYFC